MKPAVAVRALLEKHPDGLPIKTVVGELQGSIKSGSGDKKRLLYNTLFNLCKRGQVEKFTDASGADAVRLIGG